MLAMPTLTAKPTAQSKQRAVLVMHRSDFVVGHGGVAGELTSCAARLCRSEAKPHGTPNQGEPNVRAQPNRIRGKAGAADVTMLLHSIVG